MRTLTCKQITEDTNLLCSALFSPIYIETQYAYYILKSSSREYEDIWQEFYTPLRIAQIAISSALVLPASTSFRAFAEKSASKMVLEENLSEHSILAHVCLITTVI